MRTPAARRLAPALFLSLRTGFTYASPFLRRALPDALNPGVTTSMLSGGGGHGAPVGSQEFYEKMVISAILVVVGGVFAGCVSTLFWMFMRWD